MKKNSPAHCGQNRAASAQANSVAKVQCSPLALVPKATDTLILDQCSLVFPPMLPFEFESLKASIRRNGLKEPLLVWNGAIMDGRHRYKACQELGLAPIVKHLNGSYEDAKSAAFSANINRRHLKTGQRALMAAELAKRQTGQTKSAKQGQAILTQEEAARLFAVGRDSVQKASRLVNAANKALLDDVHSGTMTLNEAIMTLDTGKTGLRVLTTEQERAALRTAAAVKERIGEASRNTRLTKQAAISAKNVALPTGAKHAVVLADPPWDYGMPNDRAASPILPHNQYPTLTVDAICELDVEAIAASDAMLFLWCPASLLPDGLRVMSAWGFEYSSNWIWEKTGHKHCGGGTATVNHEILLVGKRGGGLVIANKKARQQSVFSAPISTHSTKPCVVHERIECLYPDVSRIELFSRKIRAGWTSFGNHAFEEVADRKAA